MNVKEIWSSVWMEHVYRSLGCVMATLTVSMEQMNLELNAVSVESFP